MATVANPDCVRERFQRLASKWKSETRFLSNTVQMAMLESYQAIIGMGDAAVPLILKELQREPTQWFWALQAITEVDPVPSEARGNVRAMAQAWIDWGRQRGLIDS